MEWNRSETIAVAKDKCAHCQGEGLRHTTRKGPSNPCNCVLRGIFRACYSRFRYCVSKEKYMSKVTLENCSGKDGRRVWARKDEDYIADFCIVSKRALDEEEYRIFRFHFLLGADWRLCCRRLSMDRGSFFHAVYRIQQKLGRVFRELQPFSLFPLDAYFGGTIQKALPGSPSNLLLMPSPRERRGALRPPLRRESPERKAA
ncbi:MAG: hypothetical protein JWO80_3704 [Bryobacterales bacterium]|nr:hypothetical protein [Bryobacterales bacterium]